MRKIIWLIVLFVILVSMTGCEEQKDLKKTEPLEQSDQKDSSIEFVVTEEEIKGNNIVQEDVTVKREEDVISYFETIEQEVEKELEKPLTEQISSKLKNTFITITDFLFYDKMIGNVTFNSLTEETKLRILEIASSIDTKIETKLPGYKETIKTASGKLYQSASEKINQGISSLDQYLQNKMSEETYQSMQDGMDNLKEGFLDATEIIKDTGSSIKDKVKNWYENFRK